MRPQHCQRLCDVLLVSGLLAVVGCGSEPEVCRSAGPWQEDVSHLVRGLIEKQADVYADVPEPQFEAAATALCEAIPTLSDTAIKVEMSKLVGLVHDGHTALFLFSGQPTFHLYPLRVHWFSDGLRVLAAEDQAQVALGSRILELDGRPVDEALEIIAPSISHSNDQLLRVTGAFFLFSPEVLTSFGLLRETPRATLLIENRTGQRSELMMSGPSRRYQVGDLVYLAPDAYNRTEGWRAAFTLPPAQRPLYMKDPAFNYWYEVLPDQRALYFQYNSAFSESARPFEPFWEDLLTALRTQPVDKLIIDLRFNEGGSFFTAKAQFEALRTHPINRRGHIFVLIGRKTFSAAIVNAVQLKDNTQAIFAGEEVGDLLDFYYNTGRFTLPNSGIQVQYGEGQQLFPDRLKQRLLPDLPVSMSWEDYVDGRDPVLQAVLDYREPG